MRIATKSHKKSAASAAISRAPIGARTSASAPSDFLRLFVANLPWWFGALIRFRVFGVFSGPPALVFGTLSHFRVIRVIRGPTALVGLLWFGIIDNVLPSPKLSSAA